MTYSAKDFKNDTPPRIIGSETEFTSALDYSSVTYTWNNGEITEVPGLDDDIEDLFLCAVRNTAQHFKTYNEMQVILKNGGIVQVDELVEEYATPECLTPSELLAHERAGEQIVQEAVWSMDDDLVPHKIVYKRTGYSFQIDHSGNLNDQFSSVGHHENYFVPGIPGASLHYPESLELHALNSYFSTRAVWSGTGCVDTLGYNLYQKGDWWASSIITNKGFPTLGRLEFRNGEGNMSDWAIATKFGMSSLVIRLIEHGVFPEDLVIDSPTYHVGNINTAGDISFSSKLGVSAYEHQRKIAEAALDFASHFPSVPVEETAAAQNVIDVCDQLEEFATNPDAIELLSNRVDWAAKLHYMFTLGLKLTDIHTKNYTAIMHDLQWEGLNPDSPSRQWYVKTGNILISQVQIEEAKVTPPNTRARSRADALSQSIANGSHPVVSWDTVRFVTPTRHLYLEDPYDSTNSTPLMHD